MKVRRGGGTPGAHPRPMLFSRDQPLCAGGGRAAGRRRREEPDEPHPALRDVPGIT